MIALRRGMPLTAAELFLDNLESPSADAVGLYFEAGMAAAALAMADEVEGRALDDAGRARWREQAVVWFEEWMLAVDPLLDDTDRSEDEAATVRAGLGLVRWGYEPSVRALGTALQGGAADEELRDRWQILEDEVESVL